MENPILGITAADDRAALYHPVIFQLAEKRGQMSDCNAGSNSAGTLAGNEAFERGRFDLVKLREAFFYGEAEEVTQTHLYAGQRVLAIVAGRQVFLNHLPKWAGRA